MSVEERLITSLLDGSVTMETACGSTAEIIAACLAIGRSEDLPEPYQATANAWDRLDMRQRSVSASTTQRSGTPAGTDQACMADAKLATRSATFPRGPAPGDDEAQ